MTVLKPAKGCALTAETVTKLANSVIAGERRALARAITLIESAKPSHRRDAIDLVGEIARLAPTRKALRIGLSGTPGVGKSTFIESFGLALVEMGLRVAVLAVDPSSTRTGGSILGDKTRMEQLSRSPSAYIRPSPSTNTLGGVGRRTREAVVLCEAAGFDVVLIETVGVGQSETLVADVSDIFLLLMAPAGGDELQGVKRGIMEIADLIVVNKADGDLLPAATRTCADYAGALRLLRKRSRDPEGFPKAVMASALTNKGMTEVWQEITTLADWRRAQGVLERLRAKQAQSWFQDDVHTGLLARLTSDPVIRENMARLAQSVAAGQLVPSVAAENLLNSLQQRDESLDAPDEGA